MTLVDCLNVVINMKPDSLVWVVFSLSRSIPLSTENCF